MVTSYLIMVEKGRLGRLGSFGLDFFLRLQKDEKGRFAWFALDFFLRLQKVPKSSAVSLLATPTGWRLTSRSSGGRKPIFSKNNLQFKFYNVNYSVLGQNHTDKNGIGWWSIHSIAYPVL